MLPGTQTDGPLSDGALMSIGAVSGGELGRLSAAVARGDGPRELATLSVQTLVDLPGTTWVAVVYELGAGKVIARTAAAPSDARLGNAMNVARHGESTALAAVAREVGAKVIRRLGSRAAPVGALLWAGDATNARAVAGVDVIAGLLGSALETRRLHLENEHLRELAVRTERLASVGGMTAGIAHEIRNPLVSIRTFTQLLPERYQDPEFRSSFLDLTLSEIDRICTLVGELLAYARPAEESELETAHLPSCIERALLLMGTQARSAGVRLESFIAAGAEQAAIASDRLEQILLNLVSNALAACDSGGSIELRAFGNEGNAVIEVADTGDGMSPEVVSRAFETFFTTRSEGTGLGLAIVRRLVEQAGGRVAITSTEGAGTTVRLELPLHATRQVEEPLASNG